MRITIDNIGKIKHADVDISSVTVICGTNGTGKSTIAKSLFSSFNSLSNTSSKVEKEYNNSLASLACNKVSPFEKSKEFAEKMIVNKSNNKKVYDLASEYINNNEDYDSFINGYLEIMDIKSDKISEKLINRVFSSEFNNQINNIYSDDNGIIKLHVKDNTSEFVVNNNSVEIKNLAELSSEAIYIDDFKCIENVQNEHYTYKYVNNEKMQLFKKILLENRAGLDHESHLCSKLENLTENSVINEIINNNRFKKIFDKIFENCPGKIIINKDSKYAYHLDGTDKSLDMKNVAEGMKNFLLMKLLIENSTLLENGVLILDEPEMHLHPEWQLLFAELIVLVNKYLNTHILINTHSPYFLNAVEVYTSKYSIVEPKYYLAKIDGNVYDVTDNVEEAYAELARPFQMLEDERYEE
ncbi:MAG: AAA family ATPase [Peptacetobacter hiranonis]|nr:AAA family ATPase [Peptacetobacter hiranonis]